MPEPRILLTGLAFGESPRWHQGRLWFCNWGTQEIVSLDLDGDSEVEVRVPTTLPYSVDWDGRMLVVSGCEALVLRQEPGGPLVTHADLTRFGTVFNEIVVDGRGYTYVNGGGSDPMAGAEFAPGIVALVLRTARSGRWPMASRSAMAWQ